MTETLTQRERQVLGFVALGLTDRAIASLLDVDEETIGHCLRHVYEKLNARNRAHAVYIAVDLGIDLHTDAHSCS